MTDRSKILQSLQALRYFSAILVILFHLGVLQSGYKGVDLFFVISGFTLFYRYQHIRGLDIKERRRFLINRVTKIFVLYWSVLLVLCLIKPPPLNFSIIGTVFLLPGHEAILPVSWSLSYELYFYAIFWLSMFINQKRFQHALFFFALTISTTISTIDAFSHTFKGSVVNFFLGHNFWEFLLGVFSAYISGRAKINTLTLTSLCFLSFFLFSAVNLPFDSTIAPFAYGLSGMILVFSAASLEKRHAFSVPAINVLGQASYAVYLIAPVILMVMPHDTSLHRFFGILLITALGILVNQTFEEPILKWLRQKLLGPDYTKRAKLSSFP